MGYFTPVPHLSYLLLTTTWLLYILQLNLRYQLLWVYFRYLPSIYECTSMDVLLSMVSQAGPRFQRQPMAPQDDIIIHTHTNTNIMCIYLIMYYMIHTSTPSTMIFVASSLSLLPSSLYSDYSECSFSSWYSTVAWSFNGKGQGSLCSLSFFHFQIPGLVL